IAGHWPARTTTFRARRSWPCGRAKRGPFCDARPRTTCSPWTRASPTARVSSALAEDDGVLGGGGLRVSFDSVDGDGAADGVAGAVDRNEGEWEAADDRLRCVVDPGPVLGVS